MAATGEEVVTFEQLKNWGKTLGGGGGGSIELLWEGSAKQVDGLNWSAYDFFIVRTYFFGMGQYYGNLSFVMNDGTTFPFVYYNDLSVKLQISNNRLLVADNNMLDITKVYGVKTGGGVGE